MFGGWDDEALQDVWSFDTQTLTWSSHGDGPTPLNVFMVGWGGNALWYFGGGYNRMQSVSDDLWKLVPNGANGTAEGSSGWTKMSKGPPGRFDHAGIVDPVRQVLLVVGGCTNYNDPFKDVWSYDLQMDRFLGYYQLTAAWDPVGKRKIPQHPADSDQASD
eukprot:Skav222064  [mRNA]  locus=scaffold707:288456:288938:- [translate_table: standard]